MNKQGWNMDNSYAKLPEAFFTKMNPVPVKEPKMAFFNKRLAEELGLGGLVEDEAVSVFAGNSIPDGAEPLAQAYAGHQFGHFNMLGDGRAILLGEQITANGDRVDIQLKGPGRTPYSRGGDGRAALGPMLREYIISEAMHALGIPTTRSLAVVTTGEKVYRETPLPGAILTRVASSHIRVGTFEYASRLSTEENVRALADYAIERHYPDLLGKENRYLEFLKAVIKRQASLIAQWQLVGFIHGVMNTDNMTISGETIDYGPCAFMDTFDPTTVFSSIDRQGRYAYGNQPYIGAWNLSRFAESLVPLLHDEEERAVEIAQEAIESCSTHFQDAYFAGMRKKLGLFGAEEEDVELIKELLKLMQKYQTDYTNTFRRLTNDTMEGALANAPEFATWSKSYEERLENQRQSKEESKQLMRQNNPAVIPRNHRVEEALEAAVEKEDYSVMERLLAVLADPYSDSAEQTGYCSVPDATGKPYRTYCGT